MHHVAGRCMTHGACHAAAKCSFHQSHPARTGGTPSSWRDECQTQQRRMPALQTCCTKHAVSADVPETSLVSQTHSGFRKCWHIGENGIPQGYFPRHQSHSLCNITLHNIKLLNDIRYLSVLKTEQKSKFIYYTLSTRNSPSLNLASTNMISRTVMQIQELQKYI